MMISGGFGGSSEGGVTIFTSPQAAAATAAQTTNCETGTDRRETELFMSWRSFMSCRFFS